MKKFGLTTLFILVIGFVTQLFFPWWIVVIIAALAGCFFPFDNSLASYATGFLAVSLLWGGYASFLDASNLSLMTGKMSDLMNNVGASNLSYLTGLLGGLLGGFGAMTGTLGRKMFTKTADA